MCVAVFESQLIEANFQKENGTSLPSNDRSYSHWSLPVYNGYGSTIDYFIFADVYKANEDGTIPKDAVTFVCHFFLAKKPSLYLCLGHCNDVSEAVKFFHETWQYFKKQTATMNDGVHSSVG